MSRDEEFLELYIEYRLKDQRRYYQGRRSEFDAAQQQANLVSGVVMILAGTASAAAAANWPPKPAWTVLAISLPAVAGLGQALQRLLAYDRLAKLYEDALRALAGIGAEPAGGDAAGADIRERIGAYVMKVEEVFAKEQGQWGQLTAHLDAYKVTKTNS